MSTKASVSSLLFAALISVLLLSVPAQAWWCTGHMAVAEIARRHLKPNVAKIVEKATAHLESSGPFPKLHDFVQSACWADDIIAYGLNVMQPWHFIDVPYNPQNVEIKKDPVTHDNVVTVIESLLKTLQKQRLPPYILSFAIANLLHFFGDIHQPLHSIALFSPAYPDGDMGGNKLEVYVNGKKMTLHAVWDSICQGEKHEIPRPLSEANYAKLIELVDYLEDTYKFEESQKSETNVSAMAEESYKVGLDVVYPGVENGKPLTDEYLQKCRLAAEPRVALAGYRLATALNQILGDSDPDHKPTKPMCAFSFIDGKRVPCNMTLEQVRVLFPQGLLGLHECFGARSDVFPESDGSVRLEAGASYSLTATGGLQWPDRGIANGGMQGGGVLPRPFSASSSGASWGVVGRSLAVDEQCLILPPRAPDGSPENVRMQNAGPASAFDERVATCNEHGVRDLGMVGSDFNDRSKRLDDGHFDGLHLCSRPLPPFRVNVGKHFQDRVHEYIFLPPLAASIVDTAEFQRLRSLKQLGTVQFLYPSATHTRFEHCIGVAHLASEMARHIAIIQPELRVTQEDILCVTIAGLCHDIGHGPFSHLFEDVVNRVRGAKGLRHPWHHEEMSVRLLRRILSRLNLQDYGLREEDGRFIELCISGIAPGAEWPNDIGRPACKRFLVDIVANKRNGIDVDKLDYFLRDSLVCYGRAALDVHIPRLLSACKVFYFEGESQICFEEKMAMSLGDILNVRAKLHKHAYQHRIAKVTDCMVSDALCEAAPFFKVRGKDGRLITIAECVDDDEGFCQLGDWVLNAIAASDSPLLEKAQSIIRRINERELYTVAGMAMFARYRTSLTEEDIRDEIISRCVGVMDDPRRRAEIEEALIVSFTLITFGSTDGNGIPDDPINHVTFYNPKDVERGAFKLPCTRISPLFSPSEYGERHVIVMVRRDEVLDAVRAAFGAWCESNARHLGVAVPSSNRRKDESPGKARLLSQSSGTVSPANGCSLEEMRRRAKPSGQAPQPWPPPPPLLAEEPQQPTKRRLMSSRSPPREGESAEGASAAQDEGGIQGRSETATVLAEVVGRKRPRRE